MNCIKTQINFNHFTALQSVTIYTASQSSIITNAPQ